MGGGSVQLEGDLLSAWALFVFPIVRVSARQVSEMVWKCPFGTSAALQVRYCDDRGHQRSISFSAFRDLRDIQNRIALANPHCRSETLSVHPGAFRLMPVLALSLPVAALLLSKPSFTALTLLFGLPLLANALLFKTFTRSHRAAP